MFQTIQRLPRLRCRGDITRMLVLETNDQTVPGRLFRQLPKFPHHLLKTFPRLYGPPKREHPDDPRPKFPGDQKRSLRQLRLIFKGVLRSEDVVLKPAI